ncbi:branched-chain amino acid transport system substrate-binding protein [Alkalibacillus filiformis]|uniref:Branched-chain amino acid transport system substrate-binding protein n=1 Tax=Alkalibacillus filiformis TaxID=200990 RepID=A0ABU0DPX0_9BACI|nr:substrate-binding domain-containing protein [Alkalibacillus filiformis]MDQ0350493.1 branched-chain amino acid transport system substrate-binding protein [Alkalibacillus filiformis]
MSLKRLSGLLVVALFAVTLLSACGDEAGSDEEGPIKIGVLASLSGPLEAYGVQTQQGFELGIEYATDGSMEFDGREIEVIFADTETQSDVARQRALELLDDEGVDFLVGSSDSGDTLSVIGLAEEYETIMVVEPAVADSITGSEFNPYVFRTGRNSSQDAVAGAAAIADEGVTIATFAPDYAFGWDGVEAFTNAAEELGAEVVLEEFVDPDATDFTPNIQRVIEHDPDYMFVIWAGANSPWNQIADMNLQERGIQISTGAPDIAALSTMGDLVGMEGFTVYYHDLPDNEVNDWLVEEMVERHDTVPDLFTPGGMSAALAIMEALEQSEGSTDANELIDIMEGMSFESPKGTMTFRPEDHQALQSLYAITLEEREGYDYPVPTLIRELSPDETEPPILNERE